MPISADSFEKLSEKIDEAKRSIKAAASESEAELKAKVEEARKKADDRAAELSAKVQATADKTDHWQQIQSDWEQHRQGIRQRIDEAKQAQDLEAAGLRAEWAEADARDAVDFAANAIDEATYAMLDLILANKDVKVLLETSSEQRS
jgi:chromosome segregation ATPase